jgi:hypothetical protein
LQADILERCSAYDATARSTPASLVETSVADTPAEWIRGRLARVTLGGCDRLPEAGEERLASNLRVLQVSYHRMAALSEARARIENGTVRMPADASEPDDRRATAVGALGSAVRSADHGMLVDRRLQCLADDVRHADEERTSGASATDVRRTAGHYGYATVVAGTATAAYEWLVDGLDSATDSRREPF